MPFPVKELFLEPYARLVSMPTFYGDTWHDTFENAIKCPVCKPKALAYKSERDAHRAFLALSDGSAWTSR